MKTEDIKNAMNCRISIENDTPTVRINDPCEEMPDSHDGIYAGFGTSLWKLSETSQ